MLSRGLQGDARNHHHPPARRLRPSECQGQHAHRHPSCGMHADMFDEAQRVRFRAVRFAQESTMIIGVTPAAYLPGGTRRSCCESSTRYAGRRGKKYLSVGSPRRKAKTEGPRGAAAAARVWSGTLLTLLGLLSMRALLGMLLCCMPHDADRHATRPTAPVPRGRACTVDEREGTDIMGQRGTTGLATTRRLASAPHTTGCASCTTRAHAN